MNPFTHKIKSEHDIQVCLFMWCNKAANYGFRAAFDEHSYEDKDYCDSVYGGDDKVKSLKYIHAIPNGGGRGDTKQSRMMTGAMLKAEGVKPGIPDICYPFPNSKYCHLYIELKYLDGQLSESQKEIINVLRDFGNRVIVTNSWIDAANEIMNYIKRLN